MRSRVATRFRGLFGGVTVSAALVSAALPAAHATAGEARFTIFVRLAGRGVEGRPLYWSEEEVVLLGRDGRLWEFHPGQAQDFREVSSSFHGFTAAEQRAVLEAEFGRRFEVTATRHYVVVHPRGQRDRWAERFEELYRSVLHYFAVRRFDVHEPEFPLVAVVCHNEEEFLRLAQADGVPVQAGFAGYYVPRSNRIWMYDPAAEDRRQWHERDALLIHEATHQVAFNIGIHSRLTSPPLWIVEGLGSLFEARGVWDSRRWPQRADRINVQRLRDFRLWQRQRPSGFLAQLISTDRPFRTQSQVAYAESWALAFYLAETQPQRLAEYLRRLARQPAFTQYTPAQRLADFRAAFGENLPVVEQDFLRYMLQLR